LQLIESPIDGRADLGEIQVQCRDGQFCSHRIERCPSHVEIGFGLHEVDAADRPFFQCILRPFENRLGEAQLGFGDRHLRLGLIRFALVNARVDLEQHVSFLHG
jgi:hypothetical protein